MAVNALPAGHFDTTPRVPFDQYGCKWRNFTQTLDHFDSDNPATFQQRYVVCTGAWPPAPAVQNEEGNVIVFLGNESPLSQPQQPIIFENILRMKGLIIEIEHRYYGDSIPFPLDPTTQMLTTVQYQWLTMEQVMEDTKTVLESVRKEFNVSRQVPTVVIGGSYGGQLAAYHRLTYPETFQAAIAASGPVKYVLGTQTMSNNVQKFHDIIGQTVSDVTGNATCAKTIKTALTEIFVANGTKLADIAVSMDLCGGPASLSTSKDAFSLVQNLYYAWAGNAVQVNGQAGPYLDYIENACMTLAETLKEKPGDLPAAMSSAAKYIMELNQTDCYPFDNTYVTLTNPINNTVMASYMYQCCTEGTVDQTMFSSATSNATLVPEYFITPPMLYNECRQAFGPDLPVLQPLDVALDFNAEITKTGHIVFTNGDSDGWSGGGITNLISDVKMAVIVYRNASHCTDTHSFNWNNRAEPPEYRLQRAEAMAAAAVWMEEHRAAVAKEAELAATGSVAATSLSVSAVILAFGAILMS